MTPPTKPRKESLSFSPHRGWGWGLRPLPSQSLIKVLYLGLKAMGQRATITRYVITIVSRSTPNINLHPVFFLQWRRQHYIWPWWHQCQLLCCIPQFQHFQPFSHQSNDVNEKFRVPVYLSYLSMNLLNQQLHLIQHSVGGRPVHVVTKLVLRPT